MKGKWIRVVGTVYGYFGSHEVLLRIWFWCNNTFQLKIQLALMKQFLTISPCWIEKDRKQYSKEDFYDTAQPRVSCRFAHYLVGTVF